MRLFFLAVLFCATVTAAEDKRVLAKDITDNRKVRLIAAQISTTRGQNLMAKFVDSDSKTNQEFIVRFPSHSHTTHEVTLMRIVESCVDWSAPKDRYEWHDATCEVTFSVPKDAGGYHGESEHYDRWFLLSIKIPQKP
jgi:hypothetical protein